MTTTLGEPAAGVSPAKTGITPRDEAWQLRLRDAVSGSEGKRSSAWLRVQRRAHRAGKLSAARKTDLDREIPGWSAAPEDRWLETATDLVDFEDLHGHLPAAAGDDEERRLHRWLNYQRQRSAAGKLPKARRKWLDKKLPSWTGQVT